ncbi:MAG: cyclic nucleotide-binding domain-containing protein [Myxococcota bacterium]|nr:cyclic nucleotide-binding domain-containing protein [Myxococcota bacterium]
MMSPSELRNAVDEKLADGKPAEALPYLIVLLEQEPNDPKIRRALAISLGDAGEPEGAIKIFCALANYQSQIGHPLAALATLRNALVHAPNDDRIQRAISQLHIRAGLSEQIRTKAPPPLQDQPAQEMITSAQLTALPHQELLERALTCGLTLPLVQEEAVPLPLPLFSALTKPSFLKLVPRLRLRPVAKETQIIREGTFGATLLIIASGHVRIEKQGNEVARLGPGTVVGEMALITSTKRSATVSSIEPVEYLELHRDDIAELAQESPEVADELRQYCHQRLLHNLLNTSPIFKDLDPLTGLDLLEAFELQGFRPDDVLIEANTEGSGVWVIATGEVSISVPQEGGEAKSVATLGPGDVVGEISLIKGQKTTATVTATSRVGALFLPRERFDAVIGSNQEVTDFLSNLSESRLELLRQMVQAPELVDDDDLMLL